MSTLVAYASKHGATAGIAERIAERLRANGVEAQARPVQTVREAESYDAFVIGGATYMFHWIKEATGFVRRNQELLAARPVWLFSSGPIGPDVPNEKGEDPRLAAVPKEMPELRASINARDHRVFFGAFDSQRRPAGLTERLTMMLPAARALFPEGDFRDWAEIESWADGIARELGACRPAAAVAR